MKLEDKLKALGKVLSKRYPFIKEIKLDDDAYSSTIFLKAKIDPQEIGEYLGVETKLNYYLTSTTALSFFANKTEDKDKVYNLSRKINDDIFDLNELFPEKFKLDKKPHILSYHTITSPDF